MEFKNYMALREVLDVIPDDLQIKWHPELTPRNYQDKYVAYFQSGGSTYYVAFTKAINFPTKTRAKKGLYGYYVFWDMYRGNELDGGVTDGKDKKNTGPNFSRTHKGDANLGNTIGTLKYVLSTILHFVTMLKPALISYKAADTQLSRVYRGFAGKHADRLGYEFYGRHLIRKDVMVRWGDTIDWFLKNADQVV